jgi:N-acetylmuramoyl-L-alanine amidase
MVAKRCPGWVVLLTLAAACAHRPTAPVSPKRAAAPPRAPADSAATSSALPAVPVVHGTLDLRVVYPPPTALVEVRDSSFLFGSVGTGGAHLTVNGTPVHVWPNGAWLAWVPFPRDSLMQFQLDARTPTDSARLTYAVRRLLPDRGRQSVGAAWVDSLSLAPRGQVWVSRDEYLSLTASAAEGALVRLRLPDGTLVPLTALPQAEEVPAAVRVFERDTTKLETALRRDHYVGLLRGKAVGPDPGPVLPRDPFLSRVLAIAAEHCGRQSACPVAIPSIQPPDSAWPTVEVIVGSDTVRARWPLQVSLLDTLPVVAQFNDDTAGLGTSDSLTVGRALPGGTYHWFFPTGTRAQVIGRQDADLRIRLSDGSDAWIPVVDARPLQRGLPVPRATVGSVRLTPRADFVTLRVPVTQQVPFELVESDRSLVLHLYGVVGDVNWVRYGPNDTLIQRVTWQQPAADEVTLTLELARPLWGYAAHWDHGDLLLDVRRPPAIDEADPLKGRLIAIDPGHPPAGATGPTGLREAVANLAVAERLRALLTSAGAHVLMTRTTDTPLDLWPRVRQAELGGAELLVSIHNNALPDGINPFLNNGTSVYYNQSRSVPLARTVQAELVRRLGLRDLGIGRGDLALVRGTWMPSVLTEGLFMILPDQEAALRDPRGQQLYALAVFDGIRNFLRARAREE